MCSFDSVSLRFRERILVYRPITFSSITLGREVLGLRTCHIWQLYLKSTLMSLIVFVPSLNLCFLFIPLDIYKIDQTPERLRRYRPSVDLRLPHFTVCLFVLEINHLYITSLYYLHRKTLIISSRWHVLPKLPFSDFLSLFQFRELRLVVRKKRVWSERGRRIV